MRMSIFCLNPTCPKHDQIIVPTGDNRCPACGADDFATFPETCEDRNYDCCEERIPQPEGCIVRAAVESGEHPEWAASSENRWDAEQQAAKDRARPEEHDRWPGQAGWIGASE